MRDSFSSVPPPPPMLEQDSTKVISNTNSTSTNNNSNNGGSGSGSGSGSGKVGKVEKPKSNTSRRKMDHNKFVAAFAAFEDKYDDDQDGQVPVAFRKSGVHSFGYERSSSIHSMGSDTGSSTAHRASTLTSSLHEEDQGGHSSFSAMSPLRVGPSGGRGGKKNISRASTSFLPSPTIGTPSSGPSSRKSYLASSTTTTRSPRRGTTMGSGSGHGGHGTQQSSVVPPPPKRNSSSVYVSPKGEVVPRKSLVSPKATAKRSFVAGKARLSMIGGSSHSNNDIIGSGGSGSHHSSLKQTNSGGSDNYNNVDDEDDEDEWDLSQLDRMMGGGGPTTTTTTSTSPKPTTSKVSPKPSSLKPSNSPYNAKKHVSVYISSDGHAVKRDPSALSPKSNARRSFAINPKRRMTLSSITPEELNRQKSAELSHLNAIIGNLRKVAPPKVAPITHINAHKQSQSHELLDDDDMMMGDLDDDDSVNNYNGGNEEEENTGHSHRDKSDDMARDILHMLRSLRKVPIGEIGLGSSQHSISTTGTTGTAHTITDEDGRDLAEIIANLRKVGALDQATKQLTFDEFQELKMAIALLKRAYRKLDDREYQAKRMYIAIRKLETLTQGTPVPPPTSPTASNKDGTIIDEKIATKKIRHPYEVMDDALHILEQEVCDREFLDPTAEEETLDGISAIQLIALGVLEREENELAGLIRNLKVVNKKRPSSTTKDDPKTQIKRLSLIDDEDDDDEANKDLNDNEGQEEGEGIDDLARVLAELRRYGNNHPNNDKLNSSSLHSLNSVSKDESNRDFLASALQRLKKTKMTDKQANHVARLIRGIGTDHDGTDSEDLYYKLKLVIPQPRKVNEITSVLKALRRLGMSPEERDEVADVVVALGEKVVSKLSPEEVDFLSKAINRLKRVKISPYAAEQVSLALTKLTKVPTGSDILEVGASDERISNLHQDLMNNGSTPGVANEVSSILKTLRRMDLNEEESHDLAQAVLALGVAAPKNPSVTGISALPLNDDSKHTLSSNDDSKRLHDEYPLQENLADVLKRLKHVHMTPKQAEGVADCMHNLRKVNGGNLLAENESDDMIDGLRHVMDTPYQANKVMEVLQGLRHMDMDEKDAKEMANQLRLSKGARPMLEYELEDIIRNLKHAKMNPKQAKETANILFNLRKTKFPLKNSKDMEPYKIQLRKVLPKEQADQVWDAVQGNLKQNRDIPEDLADMVAEMGVHDDEEDDKDEDVTEPDMIVTIPAGLAIPTESTVSRISLPDESSQFEVDSDNSGDEFVGESFDVDDELAKPAAKKAPSATSSDEGSTDDDDDELAKPAAKKAPSATSSDDGSDDDTKDVKYDWAKLQNPTRSPPTKPKAKVKGGDRHLHHKGKPLLAEADQTKKKGGDRHFHHKGKPQEVEEEEEYELDEEGRKVVFASRHHWKHKKHFSSILGDRRYRKSVGFGADEVLYSPLSRDQYRRRKTVGSALLKAMEAHGAMDDMVMDGFEEVEAEKMAKDEQIFESDKK